ncbi:RES family NAD+ phosphorylase [Brevundimonas sp. CEF1]|uniref:RES family NAD+ phosphorylase n=1 Tax=Brevundimonas sp. CEF1 TaxID=3442642 RepID=UPI003F514A28
MTPLPAALGGAELLAWRLDAERFAGSWDSGEGARLYGGRWNSKGRQAVYCALDPATAILEVAVHKGFKVLDTTPNVLTSLRIRDSADVIVIMPNDVPNPNWLRPGMPSAGQQGFGDLLLDANPFVVIPSAVSSLSWNLIFDPAVAAGRFELVTQERFGLDPRLHPP